VRYLKYFILLIIVINCDISNAQYDNNWTFGWHGGINFSTSPPTLFQSGSCYDSGITNKNDISKFSSAISSCSGDLLFYLGGGCQLWNKNHNLMPLKISFLPQLFANIKKGKDSLYVITTRPIVSYTWYKDNILYSNSSALLHPPTGRYNVQVLDADGCVANSSSLMFTGIANYNSSVFNIYPNPTKDILYIEGMRGMVGGDTNHGQTRIVLHDMLGKKIYDTITNGENVYSINVGGLPKGLYIILVGDVMQKIVVE